MCVGIPAKIVEIQDGGALPMATVDVAGELRPCCVAYLPEAEVGQYVFLQNGFAMSIVAPEDAAESLRTIAEYQLIPGEGRAPQPR